MGCGCSGGSARHGSNGATAQSLNYVIGSEGRQLPPGGLRGLSYVSINELNDEEELNMANKEFILAKYNHRSLGMHRAVGGSTSRDYGYHRQGDTFMVHVDDIKFQPSLFSVVVPPRPAPMAVKMPQPVTPPPPPPPAPVEEKAQDMTMPEYGTTEDEESILEQAKTSGMIELGAIPGITPAVEKAMKSAGVVTADKVAELGVDGLKKLKFVGHARAEIIYEYITENYGTE